MPYIACALISSKPLHRHSCVYLPLGRRDAPSFDDGSPFSSFDYSDSIFHQIGANAIVTIVSIVVVQTTVRVDIASIVGIRVVRRSSDKAHPIVLPLSVFPVPS